MIKIENLSKSFDGTLIFQNASFTLPNNGLVCILGESGCGKTTLLNMLAGFDSDYDGDISVHGRSLSKMTATELCSYRRDNIGFVFQNYHLIAGLSSLENILLASDVTGEIRAESTAKAKELLKKLGLSDKAEQKIETLSGGQKQRVAIARALVNNPSVILADEPTGALDRENSLEIMELLKELSKDRLVLVITHDKKCAEYADKIVTIQDGKLISENDYIEQSENTVLNKSNTPKISMFKRAATNVKLHIFRLLAISFAVAFAVTCFMLSRSSDNIIDNAIADFEAKNTAYHNGYIKTNGNENELLKLLLSDERLENIYPQYVLSDLTITVDDKTVDIKEKYPMARTDEQMSYGTMPRINQNELTLSPSLAAKFDKNIQNLIGKNAQISFDGQTYQLKISGVFSASYDDFFVSSDIEQKMYENVSGKAYSVSYDVKNFDDIVQVSEDLTKQNIASQNAADEVRAFQETFKNLNRLFLMVSVLIFAVGLFIGAILLVKQQNTRYREIGLMSALGYTKQNIAKMIFIENTLLAVMSVAITLLLTALSLVISSIFKISLIITAPQVLISILLTAILILTVGFASSFKLLNTESAEALRK